MNIASKSLVSGNQIAHAVMHKLLESKTVDDREKKSTEQRDMGKQEVISPSLV